MQDFSDALINEYYTGIDPHDDNATSFDFGLVDNLSGDEDTPETQVMRRYNVPVDMAFEIITDYIKTLTPEEKDRFYLNWSWSDYDESRDENTYGDLIVNVYQPYEYIDRDGTVKPHDDDRFLYGDDDCYDYYMEIRRLLGAAW